MTKGHTRKETFVEAKLKKTANQMNIDKSRVTA